MNDSVSIIRIKCIEQHDSVGKYADRPHGQASWICGNLRHLRDRNRDILAEYAIGIRVVHICWIARLNRKNSRSVSCRKVVRIQDPLSTGERHSEFCIRPAYVPLHMSLGLGVPCVRRRIDPWELRQTSSTGLARRVAGVNVSHLRGCRRDLPITDWNRGRRNRIDRIGNRSRIGHIINWRLSSLRCRYDSAGCRCRCR